MVKHYPVMLKEVISYLLNGGGIYLDCTVGGGGHARALLEKGKDIYLIGIDRDEEVLGIAEENLKDFEGRFSLYLANYKDLDEVLRREGVRELKGVLYDLGVSLYQIKANRGFSFFDDNLDMRMDRWTKITAEKVINEFPRRELERIIRELGEERYYKKIVSAILEHRKKKLIKKAKELSSLVERVVPKRGRLHPATKTFMALRIFINDELNSLKVSLEKVVNYLSSGSRIALITFHSLEDRVVKGFFKNREDFKLIAKLKPSLEEVRENPPSRSAKLRVYEKV